MYWYRTLLICTTISIALCAWLLMGPRGRREWTALGLLIGAIWSVEIAAVVLTLMDRSNGSLYNVAWPVYFMLLVIINQRMVPIGRKILAPLVLVFIVVWAWNIGAHGKEDDLVTLSVILGAFMLCALYLHSLWHISNNYPGRLSRSGAFWVSLAVVLYYGSLTPLLGAINYLVSVAPESASRLFWVVQVIAALHYIGIAIACIVERKTDTISLQHGN